MTSSPDEMQEIFSVRDSATDGSLTIIVRDTQFAVGEDGTIRRSAERRYSVHPSAGSDGTTIKETWIQEGYTREATNFVANTASRLLTPLWGARQWRFTVGNAYEPRARDKIVTMGLFDQQLTTLIYQVMVYDAATTPVPDSSPFLMVWAPFRHFNIAVYYTFMPVPAAPMGARFFFSTSTARINGGDYSQTHPESGSFRVEEIPGILGEFMNMAREEYLAASERALGQGPQLDWLTQQSARFGVMRWPKHSVQL